MTNSASVWGYSSDDGCWCRLFQERDLAAIDFGDNEIVVDDIARGAPHFQVVLLIAEQIGIQHDRSGGGLTAGDRVLQGIHHHKAGGAAALSGRYGQVKGVAWSKSGRLPPAARWR